jgi:hypothetical protein
LDNLLISISVSEIIRGEALNGTWIEETLVSHEEKKALQDPSSSDMKELFHSIRDRIERKVRDVQDIARNNRDDSEEGTLKWAQLNSVYEKKVK